MTWSEAGESADFGSRIRRIPRRNGVTASSLSTAACGRAGWSTKSAPARAIRTNRMERSATGRPSSSPERSPAAHRRSTPSIARRRFRPKMWRRSRSADTRSALGARAKMRWLDLVDGSNFGGTFNFASLADYAGRKPILFTVRRGNPAVSFSDVERERLRRDRFSTARFGWNRRRTAVRLAIHGSPTGTTSRRVSRSRSPPPDRRSSSAAVPECSIGPFPRRRSDDRCCSAPAVFRKRRWPRLRFRCPRPGAAFLDANLTAWQLAPDLRRADDDPGDNRRRAAVVAEELARRRIPAPAGRRAHSERAMSTHRPPIRVSVRIRHG